MLLLSDVALLLTTFVLMINALAPDPQVWLLFVVEAAGTPAYGFQRPARNAMTPRLVPPDQLTAAIVVEDVVFNLARVAGLAAAGILIAGIGLAGAYAIDLASFAASLVAIWLLPPAPRRRGVGPPRPPLGARGAALRADEAGAARDLPVDTTSHRR